MKYYNDNGKIAHLKIAPTLKLVIGSDALIIFYTENERITISPGEEEILVSSVPITNKKESNLIAVYTDRLRFLDYNGEVKYASRLITRYCRQLLTINGGHTNEMDIPENHNQEDAEPTIDEDLRRALRVHSRARYA